MKKKKLLVLVCSLFLANALVSAQTPPHLERRGQATQLIVDGKPFLVLAGELHNSSSSSINYLKPLWAPLKQKNLNTALVAVSWQLVEPQEGRFDFSTVDGIIKGARDNNMHVVLLWFGSWKNGLSHYVPDWVKENGQKYAKVVLENGHSTETLSALSATSAGADGRAFAAMMQHVKTVDLTHRVIMSQVENEVGVIGGTRDHSAMANAEFNKPIPAVLMAGLDKYKDELQPPFKKLWAANGNKTGGTWGEVFGTTSAADEAFMAWHYANYLNTVAKAGKAAYNIPMFVNTWIVQPEDKKPGDYPAGGPQSHVHDIWRVGAPAIDIKAPDVYLQDFKGITAMYYHNWNPLFIPESFSDENGAANAFYLIGHYNGIGYSPFGIDGGRVGAENASNNNVVPPLAKAYSILQQLSPEILAAQAAGKISGISLTRTDSVQVMEMNGYKVTATLRKSFRGVTMASKGYGLVISTGPDSFTVAGSNIDLVFIPNTPGPATAGLASVWEGTYQNGVWKPGRLLNGDEVMLNYDLAGQAANNRTGTAAKLGADPGILKVKLYRF